MWEKINKTYIGVIIGLALPIILYFVFYSTEVLKSYSEIEAITKDGELKRFLPAALPVLLSRLIFPNALLFFLAIWQNLLKTAKGLLIVTAILTGILTLIEIAY